MNDYDAIFRTLKGAGFGLALTPSPGTPGEGRGEGASPSSIFHPPSSSPAPALSPRPPAWISIEDGVDGLDQLQRSVHFLRQKIAHHWH